jgi:predicted acylesterase/phospholipase RssA
MKKGRVIIDGGVSEPVPVDILVSHGVKKIIAVNVLPGPGDIQKRNISLKKSLKEEENMIHTRSLLVRLGIRLRNFLRKAFTPNIFDVIMTTMQSMEYTLAEASCKKADIVLHPIFTEAASVDFHLVKGFIKRAEEETRLHLKEIKELVST